jgi:surface antigen
VVEEQKPAPPLPEDDSRLLALSVGAIAGSQLGGNVGRQLSGTDKALMQESTQRALETGTSGDAVHWGNQKSGNSGSTTPQARFTTSGGASCREFQQSVTVASQNATAYGTACRQADGRWMVVSG